MNNKELTAILAKHPELIDEMKEWVKDCQWRDIYDEDDVDELSIHEILRGVNKYYGGGLEEFIRNNLPPDQQTEGFGYGDPSKDPKHIKGERWRIKYQSEDDLKKHGYSVKSKVKSKKKKKRKNESMNNTIKKNELKEIIGGLIDEEWNKLNEVVMPNSKPTPKTAREMWMLVDRLPVGTSINFYNPNNPNNNTTAPWVYVKKVSSFGSHGGEETSFNVEVEGRIGFHNEPPVLKGAEYVQTGSELTEDEVSIALELVEKNVDKLPMFFVEVEQSPPQKKPYQGDPDHDLGDYEKHGPDRPSQQDLVESKKPLLKEFIRKTIKEVAPPGWEGTVKSMKKHKEIDNPWALAHWMKNKGYKSHKQENVNEIGYPIKINHTISKPVKKKDTEEWIVKWMTNGKRDENKTYYTTDKEDAWVTYQQMVKHAEEANKTSGYITESPHGRHHLGRSQIIIMIRWGHLNNWNFSSSNFAEELDHLEMCEDCRRIFNATKENYIEYIKNPFGKSQFPKQKEFMIIAYNLSKGHALYFIKDSSQRDEMSTDARWEATSMSKEEATRKLIELRSKFTTLSNWRIVEITPRPSNNPWRLMR